MTSKERFYATIAREKVDRPAVWMSAPIGAEMDNLCKHYGVSNWHELQVAAGDDVGAAVVETFGGIAGDAVAFGGVFAVHNDEIGVVFCAESAQSAAGFEVRNPFGTDNIAQTE